LIGTTGVTHGIDRHDVALVIMVEQLFGFTNISKLQFKLVVMVIQHLLCIFKMSTSSSLPHGVLMIVNHFKKRSFG